VPTIGAQAPGDRSDKIAGQARRLRTGALPGVEANNMKKLVQFALAATALASIALNAASPDPFSGFSETIRVGNALYESLDPKRQAGLSPHPIALETEPTPYVRAGGFSFNGQRLKVVVVSTGFVELMRRVAQARAFDAAEPGYFERYLGLLSDTDPAKGIPELPNGTDQRFKTEDLLNNQRTYFAQMVSMVVAVELSHHYLGHYEKYADKLTSDQPINTVIKRADWQKSIEMGAENSLSAGYGSESVCVFYAALEKMRQRPAWATYFLPQDENVKKLTANLVKLEKKFFNFK
jgi:hypothetical protein